MTATEWLDPESKSWSAGPSSLAKGRANHAMMAISNTEVLLVGGVEMGATTKTAVALNVETGEWTAKDDLKTAV